MEGTEISVNQFERIVKLLKGFPWPVICLLLIGTIVFLTLWLRSEISESKAATMRELQMAKKVIEVQDDRARIKDELIKTQSGQIILMEQLQRERQERQ